MLVGLALHNTILYYSDFGINCMSVVPQEVNDHLYQGSLQYHLLSQFVYIDFELKKVLLPPPLENFADISYLKENFKPHLLRDVCTLCSGALVSDSLLHMLL